MGQSCTPWWPRVIPLGAAGGGPEVGPADYDNALGSSSLCVTFRGVPGTSCGWAISRLVVGLWRHSPCAGDPSPRGTPPGILYADGHEASPDGIRGEARSNPSGDGAAERHRRGTVGSGACQAGWWRGCNRLTARWSHHCGGCSCAGRTRPVAGPRTRPDHRRVGRRPLRYRHLLASRQPIRAGDSVVGAVHLSSDGGRAGGLLAHRTAHRPGPRNPDAPTSPRSGWWHPSRS
jgi:hypothetical protein